MGLFKYLYDKKILYNRLIALNASNEIAVECFLREKIKFLEIPKIIKNTLLKINNKNPKNINDVFDIHEEASKLSNIYVNKLST